MSSTALFGKLHITNSTGMSLNDRFTAMTSDQRVVRRHSRSRSRSYVRDLQPVRRGVPSPNERLLNQLSRKHTMRAALKLKRRSMRTAATSGYAIKRGSLKAFRLAPNGRPIRTNSLTKVATMKADIIANSSPRPLRRPNNLTGRLGARRPVVGGAAQRVAQRQFERAQSTVRGRTPQRGRPLQRRNSQQRGRSAQRGPVMLQQQQHQQHYQRQQQQYQHQLPPVPQRGRSRSRSRARLANANLTNSNNNNRGHARSVSRTRGNLRGRSRSRGRAFNNNVSVKDRLGLRPGANNNRRIRGGVANGRVDRRRNANAANRSAGTGARVSRARGRSAVRTNGNTRNGRSRSRSRKISANSTNTRGLQQRSGAQQAFGRRRFSRSQQRNGNGAAAQNRNGKNVGAKGQQQQRRGRSRSRNGRGGGRNPGRNAKPKVNKEDLDKELDQYMATTKTENDMDYLLKN